MARTRAPWLVLLVVLALGAAACGGDDDGAQSGSGSGSPAEDASSGGEPLVIGYAASLSGFSANADTAGLLGVEAMVDELNAEGGIDGHPIELVVKDMQSDPAVAGTVAQELIDEGVHVILGPPFAFQAAGVVQVAAKENIPVISVTSTDPTYPVVGGDKAYLAAFGDNAQAAAAAEYARDQGYETSFIMVSPDIDYTSLNAEWFAETFEELGGENIGEETFASAAGDGQQDFSAQVTKIANLDPKPDVIYASMFMPDSGAFVQQLRQAGVDVPVYGGDGFDNEEMLEFAGSAAENVVFSTHGFATEGSGVEEFLQVIEEHKGESPENVALTALGGDAILLIKAAVEAAGSIDPEAIGEALGELEDVEVVTGTVSYAGTNGVPEKTVAIGAVEDGAFVFQDAFIPKSVPSP